MAIIFLLQREKKQITIYVYKKTIRTHGIPAIIGFKLSLHVFLKYFTKFFSIHIIYITQLGSQIYKIVYKYNEVPS